MRKFNLTYPVPTRGKDKNRIAARWNTSDVIVILNWHTHVTPQHIQELLEAFYFNIKMQY